MQKYIINVCLSTCLVILSGDVALAAKKKPKPLGQPIQESQLFSTTIKIKNGKKQTEKAIKCFGTVAGQTKNHQTKGLLFLAYGKIAKKSVGAKKKQYENLAKLGKKSCVSPSFASLDEYKGTFGLKEARTLYNRFAFGGTTQQINLAVAEGLNKTVERLTNYIEEPGIDAAEKDLQCDGYFAPHPQNRTCNALNKNDLAMDGVIIGSHYRMLKSANPFFEKVFFWIHDERLSTSTNALGSWEYYAIKEYISSVRNLARGGSYKQYMRDMMYDELMHLKYLDGESNSGYSPNENFAREFLELGTTGPKNRLGNPVYSNQDVAYAALVFTGWSMDCENGQCNASFNFNNHYAGTKIIFDDTPYRAVITNPNPNSPIGAFEEMELLLDAVFNHPRTAEHLAEDIWKEFINSHPTEGGIKELAELIRDSNYELLKVLRIVMKSRAMFDQGSKLDLIKHPIDLVIGFLRTTGLPVHYREISNILNSLGQRLLRPDTVFGWDEKILADEARVLNWRNKLLPLIQQNDDDFEEAGYDLHARFLYDYPGTQVLIQRVADQLNVELNQVQLNRLIEYMDYVMELCTWGHQTQCAAGQSYLGQGVYFLKRNQYDPHIDSGNWKNKLKGLIALIAMLPDYRMK